MKYKNVIKPKFNGVYSRNNLPKIQDRTYVINLDEHKSIETHWIALCLNLDYVRALELHIFQKKFKNSLEIKLLQ